MSKSHRQWVEEGAGGWRRERGGVEGVRGGEEQRFSPADTLVDS